MSSNSIYHNPYTYLIGWSQLNKFYYGVRFAKGCHPDDLWSSYFTSSKHVEKLRHEVGEPDIIQVRKTFADGEAALSWEHKVLQRMCVVKDERFLNRYDGKSFLVEAGKNHPRFGRIHSDAAREQLSKRNIEYILQNGHNMQGKNHTKETRNKMSLAQKERYKNISHVNKGKRLSSTSRENMSRSIKEWYANNPHPGYTKISCVHCGKEGSGGAMIRWHGDNCKLRII
jgi:hypothetical protein